MSKILALDLGTHTGWAVASGGKLVASGTQSFSPGRYEGGGMRFLRFTHWLSEMYRLHPLERVYFEEVRAHKGVDAAHVYGGFMAGLTAWCEDHSIPYLGIPVGAIKKSATGRGNAPKEMVMDAVRSWGLNPGTDNEADAIALINHCLEGVISGSKAG